MPWAEPGGRFTRDFGSECAWLMTVAGQKTVSGFLHIAWRTAGDIARRVARPAGVLDAVHVRRVARDRCGRDRPQEGPRVHHRHRRPLAPERRASIRIVTGDGAGRIAASVAEHRPNAERVLDPFHIVSWMTDALDRVGKRLRNQARRDGNTTATETC